MVALLVNNGAELNKAYWVFGTPFCCLVASGLFEKTSREVLQVLMDAGANPKLKRHNGKTVLETLRDNDDISDTEKSQIRAIMTKAKK